MGVLHDVGLADEIKLCFAPLHALGTATTIFISLPEIQVLRILSIVYQ